MKRKNSGRKNTFWRDMVIIMVIYGIISCVLYLFTNNIYFFIIATIPIFAFLIWQYINKNKFNKKGG